jgi:hypothetical protein
MFTRLFCPILTMILCAGIMLPGYAADKKEIKPIQEWKGGLPKEEDELLRKEAHKNGYIANQKDWEKLWKAWRGKEELPKIDFDKQLVTVGTATGSTNTLLPKIDLSDEGDLRFNFGFTQDGSPGFAYMILVIDREGIKTINGKPIENGNWLRC